MDYFSPSSHPKKEKNNPTETPALKPPGDRYLCLSSEKKMSDSNYPLDFLSCSIESVLCIPTKFIFLKSQSGPNPRQQSHLFSRSEVSTFLQVSMLASEMDVILSLVYESLERSNKCQLIRQSIESGKNGNLYLRALLPLLDVHAETAANAMDHVTSESFGIHQILSSLDACAVELKKFSEQVSCYEFVYMCEEIFAHRFITNFFPFPISTKNWNMADQLSWVVAPGQSHLLSNEKRAIAELEDAVADRIFHLKEMSTLVTKSDDSNAITSFCSMDEFCASLFSKVQLPIDQMEDQEHDYSTSQLNAAEALKLLGTK